MERVWLAALRRTTVKGSCGQVGGNATFDGKVHLQAQGGRPSTVDLHSGSRHILTRSRWRGSRWRGSEEPGQRGGGDGKL